MSTHNTRGIIWTDTPPLNVECPQCGSRSVHHTSHRDGIICKQCGKFAPYKEVYDAAPEGRTPPAIEYTP